MHFTGLLADHEAWVAIAFVIFVVLFGGRLWKALIGMLDRRAAAVRAELAEAARLKQQAQAMLDDATRRREQAVADAERLLQGARAEAERLSTAAATDARNSAARRERMAMDRIAAAEKAALTEVRIAAIDIASQAATRVLRAGLAEQQDAALIDHAIAGLPASLARRTG